MRVRLRVYDPVHPGAWGLTVSPIRRLVAVLAAVAAVVCGVVVAFTSPYGNALEAWIGAGIISAGVALLAGLA